MELVRSKIGLTSLLTFPIIRELIARFPWDVGYEYEGERAQNGRSCRHGSDPWSNQGFSGR